MFPELDDGKTTVFANSFRSLGKIGGFSVDVLWDKRLNMGSGWQWGILAAYNGLPSGSMQSTKAQTCVISCFVPGGQILSSHRIIPEFSGELLMRFNPKQLRQEFKQWLGLTSAWRRCSKRLLKFVGDYRKTMENTWLMATVAINPHVFLGLRMFKPYCSLSLKLIDWFPVYIYIYMYFLISHKSTNSVPTSDFGWFQVIPEPSWNKIPSVWDSRLKVKSWWQSWLIAWLTPVLGEYNYDYMDFYGIRPTTTYTCVYDLYTNSWFGMPHLVSVVISISPSFINYIPIYPYIIPIVSCFGKWRCPKIGVQSSSTCRRDFPFNQPSIMGYSNLWKPPQRWPGYTWIAYTMASGLKLLRRERPLSAQGCCCVNLTSDHIWILYYTYFLYVHTYRYI